MDNREILDYKFKYDIRKSHGEKEGLIDLAKRFRSIKPLSKIRMVEVGSFSGVSAFIFAGKGVGKLYCVDPWKSGYDKSDSSSDPEIFNMQEVEEQFDKIQALYPSTITKMKMTSMEAVKEFKDGSLDIVYIDGNHTEKYVRKDIEAWLPKVAHNGIIAGHDYGNRHHPHVKAVVDSIFGIPDKVFSDTSWMVKLRGKRTEWTPEDVGTPFEIKFKEFIKNKRVMCVGPSPILKGRGLGDFIDSYDIVVRTNGAINLIDHPDYIKDYGKRCDVLYVNGQFMREGNLDIPQAAKRGLKAVVFKVCSRELLKEYNKFLIAKRLGNIRSVVVAKLPSALMGVFMIEDLFQCSPSEIFLTGVDFYHSRNSERFIQGDFSEYIKPEYLPKKAQDYRNKNLSGKKDGHDPLKNTQHLFDLYQKGVWKTHDFIEELMKEVLEKA